MRNQETDRSEGFSGFTVLLWFAGGALVGAAAAYMAQAQNRAHVRELAQHARDRADGFAGALRDASSAARTAFAQSSGGNGAPK